MITADEGKQLLYLFNKTVEDRQEWLDSEKRIEEIGAEIVCLENERDELKESMEHFYSKVSDYAMDLMMQKTGEK